MARSSAVYIDAVFGRDRLRTSVVAMAALPTPSLVLDPSVNME